MKLKENILGSFLFIYFNAQNELPFIFYCLIITEIYESYMWIDHEMYYFHLFFSYLCEQMRYQLYSIFRENFFFVGIAGPWFGNIFTFWYFWIYSCRSCPQRSWERSTAKVGSEFYFAISLFGKVWQQPIAYWFVLQSVIWPINDHLELWILTFIPWPYLWMLAFVPECWENMELFFLMNYWYSLLCRDWIAL